MEKATRETIIEDLLKEVKFSMTRDIVSATNYLKRAREIRSGKQAQRKAKREARILQKDMKGRKSLGKLL